MTYRGLSLPLSCRRYAMITYTVYRARRRWEHVHARASVFTLRCSFISGNEHYQIITCSPAGVTDPLRAAHPYGLDIRRSIVAPCSLSRVAKLARLRRYILSTCGLVCFNAIRRLCLTKYAAVDYYGSVTTCAHLHVHVESSTFAIWVLVVLYLAK